MRFNLPRVFLALLVLDLALEWSGVARGLAVILTVTLVPMGLILVVRYGLRGFRRSIWLLRNRLIMTYVFIAVVPIALIIGLIAIGTYIVVGQVGVYLVRSELERRAAILENPARLLSEAKPAEWPAMTQDFAPLIENRLPNFEVLVNGDKTFHYPSDSQLEPPAAGWSKYAGFVLKGGKYYCASIVQQGKTRATLLAPIDTNLLAQLVPGIALMSIRRDIAGSLPPAYNFLDFTVSWLGRFPYVLWNEPANHKIDGLVLQTRPSAILGALFGNKIEDEQIVFLMFEVVGGLLLLVWLFSFAIGASLARSITGSVHGLYAGTTSIAKGDFAYRIPVKGKDQLAELGQSFNNMTAQIQSLVEVAKEKERLQSEVEIASEVQNQLFPQSAPVLRTIELVGKCQPARMVSGDYYDYLCLNDGSLAVAIGDVAGKGISAALLMASIQSIMRTQLAAGLQISVAAGHGHPSAHFCTASVVAQLNRQLYASTAPEKYATFFFGVYDENSRTLTYTNAGHLPPLLVRGDRVTKLEVTGTVIGLFPVADYKEQTVRIEDGDLLIAYTDGITEPENAYGEEFGVERLAEVVMHHRSAAGAEVIKKVMEAVAHWSTAAELPDDMTVVLARGRA